MSSSYKIEPKCEQEDASEFGNSPTRSGPRDTSPKAYAHSKRLRRHQLKASVRTYLNKQQSWEQYVCQAPTDQSDKIKEIIDKMSASRGIDLPDDALYQVEGIVALYFSLSRSVDMVQAIAIISLYLQRFYTKSVVELAVDSIVNLSVTNQAGPYPDWLALLKEAQTNWKLVIANEGFSHLSRVLSIMLGLGMCDSSNIDFTVAGMKLFNVQAERKQVSALTLVDAIFSTISYFVEGGYECYRQGTIKPLLYGDLDMHTLEKQMVLVEQYAEFAKTGDLEKRANLTNNDFDTMLRNIIDKMDVMVKTTKNIIATKMLRDKLDRMRKIQTYFMQTRVQGGLREAPWAAGVHGKTGVGKSSVANILMICVLMHNGYCASDDVLITLNDGDKFMSNYRSNTNGIFIDDEGNTKVEYVEKAPSARKIELVNNVRAYANMAEAELKGKISLEPKVVISTKNPKDGGCGKTSNEPASIARREQILITTVVRPEYATHNMLDAEKAKRLHGGTLPLIPDLWTLTIERAFPVKNPTEGRPDLVGWEVLTWHDKEMKDISIHELIRYCCATSSVYFDNQRSLVENSNNLAEKLDFCATCRLPACMCACDTPAPVDENQAGALLAPVVWSYYSTYQRKASRMFSSYMNLLESQTISEMTTRLTWLESSRWANWTNYVPTDYIDNDNFYKLMLAFNSQQLKKQLATVYAACFLVICFVFVMSYTYSRWLTPLCVFPLYRVATAIEIEKARLYAKVKEDNKAMPEIFRKYRDGFIEYITGACVVLSFLYLLAQTRELIRVIPTVQGNLSPTSYAEVAERDAEAHIMETIAEEQNWTSKTVLPIPCAEQCKTITTERLKALVRKNLALFTFLVDGKKYGCNIFFMESNLAIVPRHIWVKDEFTATVSKGETCATVGATFDARFSRRYSVDIEGTDMSLAYVPNGGSWKDLTKYLPLSTFKNVPATFMYKHFTDKGKMVMMECDTYMNTGEVGNTARQFYGAKYNLDFNTFVGLCMAPLITDSKQSVIGGFHLGGITGTPAGTCGSLFFDQYQAARKKMALVPGVVIAASEGTMETEIYDVQFFQNPTIHPKSPLNSLPSDAHVEVYGTCSGRSDYYSNVIDTDIKSIVEEVCDTKCKFGPPKFYLRKAWSESLGVSCKPSIGVEGNLLAKAVTSYVVPMLAALEKVTGFADIKQYVRPLTEMENVCGIDGVRFIDQLKASTSIGYPLTGPKSKYIELLDPALFPNQECPARLERRFWEQLHGMELEYLDGRRCHIVFKACLKDEATKLTKDKVRVFQAAPIALQLGMRKYFLPLARLLSLLPLVSECAVGINTNGPEWDQLVRHMRKHGIDRILAGDYSKYDLRMPAQLTMAAFDVLIRMAKHFGYSEDDLTIMRGLATDVCYPVIAYNGDLLQLFGSNPSGQSLTVYINSIVNSLLLRCAFFHIYEGRKTPDFRVVASMMTYGDDVKGSVKKGYDEFNHISFANFLKERDIVFTMPDKESLPTKYMNDIDADFLKQKNVWCPELKMWMGALDEDSIFKSLMCVVKSTSIGLKEQSIQNIDGSLRDWFYHGREMYETRREQMNEVATRAGLVHGCRMLDRDYEHCLNIFRTRYTLEDEE